MNGRLIHMKPVGIKAPLTFDIGEYDYGRISSLTLTIFGRRFARKWPNPDQHYVSDSMVITAADQLVNDFWRFIGAA